MAVIYFAIKYFRIPADGPLNTDSAGNSCFSTVKLFQIVGMVVNTLVKSNFRMQHSIDFIY